MQQLIINIIKLLCPYLRQMAAKTDSPIDDMVVNIICGLVLPDKRDTHDPPI